MDGFEAHLAGSFLGANPHCSGSADQRKWIVANDLGGAFNLKLDRVIRKRPNRSELVSDAQHYTGGIRAIGDQLGVVGKKQEFRIDTRSRESLFDRFLTPDIALNPQISPLVEQLAHFEDEGSVAKTGKLF